ncbi:hypothetical protein KEM48_013215 [Puccinia striiformis f. sp. tritici PST-130]|nr:hypothetical protein KEM48_013215 [Puccinia striiformis f. sp. tritici PST-130]
MQFLAMSRGPLVVFMYLIVACVARYPLFECPTYAYCVAQDTTVSPMKFTCRSTFESKPRSTNDPWYSTHLSFTPHTSVVKSKATRISRSHQSSKKRENVHDSFMDETLPVLRRTKHHPIAFCTTTSIRKLILIHLIFTCVAGGIALFDCSAYGYCADKMTSSTGAVYYRFGLAEPTQDVNSWTCSYSQLAGKHIVNVCCNNPVGLTKRGGP